VYQLVSSVVSLADSQRTKRQPNSNLTDDSAVYSRRILLPETRPVNRKSYGFLRSRTRHRRCSPRGASSDALNGPEILTPRAPNRDSSPQDKSAPQACKSTRSQLRRI